MEWEASIRELKQKKYNKIDSNPITSTSNTSVDEENDNNNAKDVDVNV